ncbi:MAG: DUF3662 domain-containing protein [Actinobacteria bacterium]|uniref:Unannotated protein n=1 Tax=freshwater metagenome TaxID=449393 RepID=A0A6J6EDN8_9ZZZZ|nr:DUF3662 domain-containing protein [Actinomycetota bacterium]MTA90155.1 DUF3662 domain-containing protein [Actinomycetota bacterium]
MGFLDKAEERIESAVNSLFAKFSKAQLQPVEVSQAIRSAMDLAAKKDPIGATVVPHKYLLLINASDADKITPAMLGAIRSELNRYVSEKSYRILSELELNVSIDNKIAKGSVRVGSQPVEQAVNWVPVLLYSGVEYRLKRGANTVGRDEKADIFIDDRGLSRFHFEIAWNGETAAIRDLQSTNGTSVDGIKVNEVVLQSGNKITAGRSEFEFQLQAGAVNE